MSPRLIAAVLASLLAGAAHAQVPSIISTGVAVDTFETIGAIADSPAVAAPGAVARKVYTVPAGRAARLTDLSLDPRNADTDPSPCFFELWRGTDTEPVTPAWSRVRVRSAETYDRSWVTGPQFATGESIWLLARFNPTDNGQTICTRLDPTFSTELRFALKGYLIVSR